MEKIAFQCANSMGKSFNMANPFLDAESAELRMNFVHDSIAKNGIAVLIRKTPAKIRLQKDKIIAEDYIRLNIHDFLLKCVEGHCNIMVSGETGSGPHRDIVAMKTNNIASYSDVLVTCMRQNPRWILLSEVRSAEAVMAVRNSISSGHNILSTIHADKAESIPSRMYSLLETNQDIDQFLKTIHRYVQLGVHIKGYYSTKYNAFHREVSEVVEFYVTDDNKAEYKILYKKTPDGKETTANPSKYLLSYLESQGVIMPPDILIKEEFTSLENNDNKSSRERMEEIMGTDGHKIIEYGANGGETLQNLIINNDKVGEFVVDNSLYTESQNITSGNQINNTIPNNYMVNNMNTNNVVNSPNNIPNIYTNAVEVTLSVPNNINVTSINNNQNIS